ncbi:hypothetical protein C1Y40_02281 [Mycobacterium talmoniae]|uniref:Uncharacterized protein n=1 Tax=Mycobacterium talmoniae TaxID=1858794 RepID=A0A2S8BLQ4_9MYCO|nr:hypothetical protein C1Y40_02281 [Mycobacterium talmoniae]
MAVGGAVEQLRRGERLRDDAEKRQLHLAGAQHGAGHGVLEARWGQVEGVVVGLQRMRAALQVLVRSLADPLNTVFTRQAVKLHSGILA